MKTIYIFQSKTYRLLSLFVCGIAVTSCGSYQNSSYYDNDGAYGSKTVDYEQPIQNESVVIIQNGKNYEQQFGEMKEDFGPTEIFTDVDSYKSTTDTVYVMESNSRYAGWGENQTGNITVNVYDNWGWNRPYYGGWYNGWYGNNWGWGWNSWYGGYYGNSWGLGWGWNSPYCGWAYNGWYGGYYGNGWYGNGWNGPYWGNGWYGGHYVNGWYGNGLYGRKVAYNDGPRGGNIYTGDNTSTFRNSSRTNGDRRINNSIIGTPRSTVSPRGNSTGTPRTISTPSTNNNTGTPRTVVTPRENNTGTPRNQASEPRNNSTPRNNTSEPRTISTPRNSDFGGGGRSSGGGSFGGGNSGGGGRSSGGGRGGRG